MTPIGRKEGGPGRRRGTGTNVASVVGGAVILLGVLFALLLILGFAAPRSLAAQELADFDYANLSLRGFMGDTGYIFPSRVEPTWSYGGRVDLGFLGPGVRVVTGFTRWSSRLKPGEVARLSDRMEDLVFDQTGETVEIDLGEITWSDVAVHADAHFLWRVPFGMLTYAGLGGSTHILRGGGEAIDDTFVEDLLDSVRAGLNVHGGVEAPLTSWFRLVGEGRWEVLENLRYWQLRVGGQLTFGALAPGEQR